MNISVHEQSTIVSLELDGVEGIGGKFIFEVVDQQFSPSD